MTRLLWESNEESSKDLANEMYADGTKASPMEAGFYLRCASAPVEHVVLAGDLARAPPVVCRDWRIAHRKKKPAGLRRRAFSQFSRGMSCDFRDWPDATADTLRNIG